MPISIFLFLNLSLLEKDVSSLLAFIMCCCISFIDLKSRRDTTCQRNQNCTQCNIWSVNKNLPQDMNCQQTQYAYSLIPKIDIISQQTKYVCSLFSKIGIVSKLYGYSVLPKIGIVSRHNMFTEHCLRQKLLAHTKWLLIGASELQSKNFLTSSCFSSLRLHE